ncbi:MAG TPA: diacylglycerol kinase family protein [Thermoanaerobaculia bacterium]|nr:diacylglycerol kinase family protein [Thermoanaerobaculia bacterium]
MGQSSRQSDSLQRGTAAAEPFRRGVLIYNPTAGQRDRRPQMDALIGRLRAEGLTLVNAPTTGPGHATEIVRAFLPLKPDVIAACGGDGTISEVARGLSGSGVPLAVLPGGTSNVLARELSIPLDPESAAGLLFAGRRRSLRVLLANDRPFLLWAGAGLDARIMGKMNLTLKRRMGRAGILLTAASEYARYEFPSLQVMVDGEAYPATFAVVCHARHYAGDWVIAPQASLESDVMDVMLFSERSHLRLLRLFLALRRGRADHLSGLARIVRGRRVEMRSREAYAVEVHADGDCVLQTPVTCRASLETVEILVPPAP